MEFPSWGVIDMPMTKLRLPRSYTESRVNPHETVFCRKHYLAKVGVEGSIPFRPLQIFLLLNNFGQAAEGRPVFLLRKAGG